MTLHIEDDVSGMTLLDLRLTPEQAYGLMRGTALHIDGVQTDRLDRVGKQMVNDSVEVPGRFFNDAPYADREKLGEQWARENVPGWDSYEASRTNTGGVRVVVRKWVA
jgi:hypothetical protein